VTAQQHGDGVVWSRVDEGFHVGSRAGEFVGFVDRQDDGAYLACDRHSRPIGRFDVLEAATDAVATDSLGRVS
jgi:hypothetical protein